MRTFLLILVLCCPAFGAGWVPPVGIPEPSFGIRETRQMYTEGERRFDYGKGPEAYRRNEFGPYTHIVQNSHPQATDKDNPFGSPDRPRLTWPYPLPAGASVQVHPGKYDFKNFPKGKLAMGGAGAKEAPIFVYGVSTNKDTMPAITARECYFFGDWLVVENLKFQNDCRGNTRPELKGAPVLNTVIRDCVFEGTGTAGRAVCVSTGGSAGNSATNFTQNLVILRNQMRGYGDWKSEKENDACGVIASEHSTNVWILDNDIFNMGGDSIRIGADQGGAASGSHYYVGRNRLHDNRENALDIKQARNAVVSENVMHGFKPTSSSSGVAIVMHYQPQNVWILSNTIFNANTGIASTGIKDAYVIGNIIYDCSRFGMQLDRGGGSFQVANNTINNCGSGMVTAGRADALLYRNNIIANISDPAGSHLMVSDSAVASRATAQCFLFFQSGSPIRIKWKGAEYNNVKSWASANRTGAGSLQADPQFQADSVFQLGAASPAKGRSVPIADLNNIFSAAFGTSLLAQTANADLGASGVAWARRAALEQKSNNTKL